MQYKSWDQNANEQIKRGGMIYGSDTNQQHPNANAKQHHVQNHKLKHDMLDTN